MKTASTHEHHGILLRDDSYGWCIQIRLNGSYRLIKTHASDANTAARRHDVALNKLRAFLDEGAYPNFPAEFPPELIEPDKAPEDYNKFRGELNNIFQVLVNELEGQGINYDERFDARENVISESLRRRAAKDRADRDLAIAALHRVNTRVARISSLTAEQRRSLEGNLEAARKTLG